MRPLVVYFFLWVIFFSLFHSSTRTKMSSHKGRTGYARILCKSYRPIWETVTFLFFNRELERIIFFSFFNIVPRYIPVVDVLAMAKIIGVHWILLSSKLNECTVFLQGSYFFFFSSSSPRKSCITFEKESSFLCPRIWVFKRTKAQRGYQVLRVVW